MLLRGATIFSGFSVDDLAVAKEFYADKLGLDITQEKDMGITLNMAHGAKVFIYPKPDHQPATFTVLNFLVDDIDQAVDTLTKDGIVFEHYDDLGGGAVPDEKGILRGLAENMGPDIAWFKDPAGNVLSVVQDK